MLNTELLKALPLGTRVVFPTVIDCYPAFLIQGPQHGAIVYNDGDMVEVMLDVEFPELDEWGNRVQVTLWDEGLPYAMTIER